jgi:acyl-coenzyme A synthetase/AMP-(fatty) acid ligase
MDNLRDPRLWNIEHELYTKLRKKHAPGLVLFTSGTSGDPKVALHDASRILDKWHVHEPLKFKQKNPGKVISFLGFDHIGGINTILHVLCNGGTLVYPRSRDVEQVTEVIDKYTANILPTSPSFLRMMLLKCQSSLPSINTITYGTEPMPQSLLEAVHAKWPHIKLKQTYGLTETGIFSTQSKSNDSLWIKLKAEYRIVEGLLEIKTQSSMLGYLNSESPYTEDGWYQTKDCVEVDGEWIKICGRKSEFINIGGEKVHPSEIESDVLKYEGVIDCIVTAIPNPILGQISRIKIFTKDHIVDFRREITHYLRKIGYPDWKIPQKWDIVFDPIVKKGNIKKNRKHIDP